MLLDTARAPAACTAIDYINGVVAIRDTGEASPSNGQGSHDQTPDCTWSEALMNALAGFEFANPHAPTTPVMSTAHGARIPMTPQTSPEVDAPMIDVDDERDSAI